MSEPDFIPPATDQKDHNIWPAITSNDPHALRAWLRDLGFVDGVLVPGEGDGEIQHSEMVWPEGGRVMVHSATRTGAEFAVPVGSCSLYVVTDQPDEVFARAQRLSAPLIRPMAEEDYGSRGFSIADPDGNRWSFGSYAG